MVLCVVAQNAFALQDEERAGQGLVFVKRLR
jgi:hypothetical protein